MSLASCFLLVFFVKKLGKGIQFCVNYKRLNAIIKKDRYPISFIKKILAQLEGAKCFTKINIYHIFYQIRVSKDLKELIIFQTRFDAIKYLVILFSLYNSPAS